MERDTIAVYEARAAEWRAKREARFLDRAALLASHVAPGGTVADLGCGAGLHLPHLPRPAVALDAARAMVGLAREAAPEVPGVAADLVALPFRRGALGGAWARASYVHLPRAELPWALAELHHALAPGAPAHLTMMAGAGEGPYPDDDFAGRFFARWEPDDLADVVVGAGFDVVDLVHDGTLDGWIHALVRRVRTLPDTVGAGMRLLVCGLNPSLYSADRGMGFARPGNRFWPAALAAGVVTRDRDPRHALVHHRVGMTDLVKRATVGASALTRDEYREGAARVERLVRWLLPGAVCFVGLSGWRAAVDRRAGAGVQPDGFGGVPAYVMPNTSGLNARVPLAELADHLRAASELASP
ncbi:MAG TPA: methyltransferase domain-containing protein, partial [Acidimicrobiia bacterium]